MSIMYTILFVDTSVCLPETDVDWNITWPLTTRGEVVLQKCPGGAESLGMYYDFKFQQKCSCVWQRAVYSALLCITIM